MRKHWIGYLILTISLTLIMNPASSGTIALHNMEPISDAQLDQIESNYTLVLETSTKILELGNTMEISYGVLNVSNYIGDLNFTLSLSGLNETATLLNTTTLPFKVTYEFDSKVHAFRPGNYSLIFAVSNTTSWVNTTSSFEIITQAGANVDLILTNLRNDQIITDLDSLVLATTIIQLTLKNLGESNSFNVVFTFQPIEEPVGMQTNTSQPINIPFLGSLEEYTANFSVKPDTYGRGKIQFNWEYKDGNGATFQNTRIMSITTKPGAVDININAPTNLVKNGEADFELVARFFGTQDFDVYITIASDIITFIPDLFETSLSFGQNRFKFKGTPTANGTAAITVKIVFADWVDNEEIELASFTKYVPVFDNPQLPDITITQFLIGLLIFVNAILLLSIIILYFRKDIRKRIIERFFKMSYVPDLNFPVKSVIVDGSNIAWEELNKNGKPQMENITLCVSRLKEYGFEEIVVLADAALRYQLEDPVDLDSEVKLGNIKVLPAKVNGDSFILRLSSQKGSLILTNDLFKEFRGEFPFIDERRIPYTILNGQFFLHPLFKNQSD